MSTGTDPVLEHHDTSSASPEAPHRSAPAGGTAPRPLRALLVLVLGYGGMVLVLVAVGEIIVHWGPLGGLRRWDEDVCRWLADRRFDLADGVTGFMSRAADTFGVILCAVVVEVALAIQRRWWALLVVPIGLGLELATFLTVNTIVDRPRPAVPRLGSEPSTSSFPSGHTAATVVLWGTVVILFGTSWPRRARTVAWVVVIVFAIGVGTSRVYRGMHHPTDVLLGAVMGAIAVAVTVVALGQTVERGERREVPR